MATTYDKIATTTLGGSSATVTLSSIPATYTDLRVVFVPLGTSTQNMNMTINGDTGSNYSWTNLRGDGGGTEYSARATSQSNINLTYGTSITTTKPNLYEIDIFSYAGSTYKTLLNKYSADKNGSGNLGVQVVLWSSTSAITSVTFTAATNFAANTILSIYGIKAA
jgi:hypothetical protein